jgi:hypothetical protein
MKYVGEDKVWKQADLGYFAKKQLWSGARKTHKDTDNFLVTVGEGPG